MSNAPVAVSENAVSKSPAATDNMYVTMFVAGQLFGIPVLQVQDVLGVQNITHVPLAPEEVLGSLNLRGRIVTAVDVRTRLNLSKRDAGDHGMSVVVEYNGDLFSLVVDRVGEVMSLPSFDYEKNPPTLDPRWQDVSDGIYRLKDSLLIVLNVRRLLCANQDQAA